MTVDELRRALADIPGDVPVGVYVKGGNRSTLYENVGTGTEGFAIVNAPVGMFWVCAKDETHGLKLAVFDAAIKAMKAITLLDYRQAAGEPAHPDDEKDYNEAITQLIVSVDDWIDGGGK